MKLTLAEVLFFYEEPLVVLASSPIGGRYIGVGIPGDAQYLLVGILPKTVQKFKSGLVDLRDVVLESCTHSDWMIGTLEDCNFININIGDGELPEELIPSEGFVLEPSVDPTELAELSLEQGMLLAELVLHPATSIEHTMPADDLGRVLLSLQKLIKNAYSYWRKSTQEIGALDGHVLNLMKVSPGSVKLTFAGEAKPDLFNSGAAAPALQILSELVSAIEDPNKTKEVALGYGGRLASSYKDFVETLSDLQTSVSFSWSDGLSPETTTSEASLTNIQTAEVILSSISEQLSIHESFTGALDLAGISAGRWTLIKADGTRVSGRVDEDGPSLENLVIGKYYTFNCIIKTGLSGTGKEKETILVQSLHGPFDELPSSDLSS